MNNYQAQQFWNDINGVIGFTTSVVAVGFMVGMVRSSFGEGKALPEYHSAEFSDLVKELKSSINEEIEYFESPKGYETFGYSPANKFARRSEEASWGKIKNGYVTLFHGVTKELIPEILSKGLKAKRIGEFPKLVWFGATPYMAFYFGDTAVQVSIPASWVTNYVGGLFGEYMVERNVPVNMVTKIIKFEEWSPGDIWKEV